MNTFPLLSLVIFLPLIGAALLFAVRDAAVRATALIVTAGTFVMSLPLWIQFDAHQAQMQFAERADWISVPPISYSVGLDGISLPLVIMTTFL
ncbi:MAG: NADH-quinone oxidoreductase subunit M, partial [Nitrospirota bacterium]|nr:NADH-quinone oxidoreductase subunit M [Nitrospirota bacterium]